MALADSITALGTAIINLVGTRLNRDANNFSTAGTQNLNNMIDSRIGAVTGAPVGTVIAYMGTDEPEGFLLMDGRELSRTTYAALFAVIGTSQGAGNGSTTFNIADMTDGRYLMGSTVAGSSQPPMAPLITASARTLETKEHDPTTFMNLTGAFYLTTSSTQDRMFSTGSPNWSTPVLNFNSSRSSSIYQAGGLLRPLSVRCRFYVKYL